MRVTRDPNELHLADGGSFIGNMNACEFYLDGKKVFNRNVVAADNEEMYIDVIKRTDDGYPIVIDDVLQLERKQGETVSFHCPEEDCTDCTRANREKRIHKKWWLL